jgi:hypothetical protein
MSVYIMSVLFLPGTFIHELSHFAAALLLFVPVGDMQLVPKIKEESVELGSVSIAKTDFVRSFFISVAPIFVGTGAILLSILLVLNNRWYENFWIVILVSYFIFTVSNTMFISKKDAQETLGFLVFVILVTMVVVLLGLGGNFSLGDNLEIIRIIDKSSLYLVVPVVLDVIILLF